MLWTFFFGGGGGGGKGESCVMAPSHSRVVHINITRREKGAFVVEKTDPYSTHVQVRKTCSTQHDHQCLLGGLPRFR